MKVVEKTNCWKYQAILNQGNKGYQFLLVYCQLNLIQLLIQDDKRILLIDYFEVLMISNFEITLLNQNEIC